MRRVHAGSVREVLSNALPAWVRMTLSKAALLLYTPRQNLRRPPDPSPLWPSQLHLWLKGGKYHSIFAPASPLLVMNEYIVYHTNQAYPEYLVDYTLV